MITMLVKKKQYTDTALSPLRVKKNETDRQDRNPFHQLNVSQVNYSDEGMRQAQVFHDKKRSTIYDQPDFKTCHAISIYREINHQQRREAVEALIGVNVFV